MFGVNEFDFLLSVCGNANFIEFISNAKSGQFFFYSSDGKYMIKTMTNTESKFLRRSKFFFIDREASQVVGLTNQVCPFRSSSALFQALHPES
jgi:Phosphatidylinositol-4-phosphate 5-Kinase